MSFRATRVKDIFILVIFYILLEIFMCDDNRISDKTIYDTNGICDNRTCDKNRYPVVCRTLGSRSQDIKMLLIISHRYHNVFGV